MSKRLLKEHEYVRITKPTEVLTSGKKPEKITLPAGVVGAVVYILGQADSPRAYLVEFYLEEADKYAHGDVPPEFLEPEHGWDE